MARVYPHKHMHAHYYSSILPQGGLNLTGVIGRYIQIITNTSHRTLMTLGAMDKGSLFGEEEEVDSVMEKLSNWQLNVLCN